MSSQSQDSNINKKKEQVTTIFTLVQLFKNLYLII